MMPWWARAHRLGIVGALVFLTLLGFYVAAWIDYLL